MAAINSSNPPKPSDEVEAILINLKRYNMGIDPIEEQPFPAETHYLVYPELKEAKQAITAIIERAVVEELKGLHDSVQMFYFADDDVNKHDAVRWKVIKDRIASLERERTEGSL